MLYIENLEIVKTDKQIVVLVAADLYENMIVQKSASENPRGPAFTTVFIGIFIFRNIMMIAHKMPSKSKFKITAVVGYPRNPEFSRKHNLSLLSESLWE